MAFHTNQASRDHEDMEPNYNPSSRTSTDEDTPDALQDSVEVVIQNPTQPAAGTAPVQTPQHPLLRLPAELIADIIDYLPQEAFINFVFADYTTLRAVGLAPVLSRRRLIYITTQMHSPALFCPLLTVPPELMLHIMRHLRPMDVMRFVIANYRELSRQGIAPPVMGEIKMELEKALRNPG